MKDDISGPSLASAALRIHQGRMRVSVENIANAHSTASVPDGEPYRRKIAVFEPITGNTEEAPAIRIVRDKTEFPMVHSPGHPAADAGGNLKLPNVRPTVEMSDLRSAMRAYEANLRTIATFDDLKGKTLALLKS
ncbi:flagellar basal body rod C-terminal domain-containing protein [Methylorubrum thiocyanatum]|uniref:Flagellar basal-body rod protein FlgC n=1 Tax=Methylorubrum thiocyanatum TaxID=47958 RepID=A0AA40S525_9HYPH|nr:flagellar basal body rod C-terminal domain-containing protein [Methylorubrum thiocyanatum]MBA8914638.1 flagellar basal-body rod protein FlgC [Methylorubrum thiocyanatum]GJE81755.1 Flagellar basal-body rod protein FlgC [Methylorubrum thiocyanatum]